VKLKSVGRFELAAVIALSNDTGAWMVVGADDPRVEGEDLAREIAAVTMTSVEVVMIDEPTQLGALSSATRDRTIVFVAVEGAERLPLDEQRSVLKRDRSATLVMPIKALAGLATRSPHFTSWIGSEVHVVAEDRFLDQESRNSRLAALRTKYGMSDHELIASTTAGRAPEDPEIAEWLVLIERGDLLQKSAR